MVSTLFNIDNEFQFQYINHFLVKLQAITLIFMAVIVYFEMMLDIERSYLSPF